MLTTQPVDLFLKSSFIKSYFMHYLGNVVSFSLYFPIFPFPSDIYNVASSNPTSLKRRGFLGSATVFSFVLGFAQHL